MPGPSAQPLSLTTNQYEILSSMLRQHTAPQRLVRRARIILATAEGLGLTETAQRLNINITTVQTWRNRWRDDSEPLAALDEDRPALARAIEETLSDAPRSGTPPTFSAEEVAQIIALACEDPRRYDREVTHWTPEELADEVVKQGITESISPRTVGRFLKRSRPQTPPEPVLAPSRG
jgi:transposase